MKERDVDVYTVDVGSERGEFLAVAARNFFDFYRGELGDTWQARDAD